MKLTFYGAAGEVTGSKTLIETGGQRFLLDCGLFHGESEQRNAEPFTFQAKSIDAVIITHAHLDHIGLLPKLIKEGFTGPVYTTEPTRLISKLMWEDAAKIQAEETEGGGHRIYDLADVQKTYKLLQSVKYDEWRHLPGGVEIRFRDAGHILGSAFIELRAEGLTLVGSGDIGNDDVPIIKNTEPLAEADVIIMESTYGARNHESARGRSALLRRAILDIVKQHGTLIIPAFSLERTQEIIYEINGLIEGGSLPKLPVFLDGPLAINLLPIYRQFPELYDNEAMFMRATGDDFFRFPGLEITLRARESFNIDAVQPPKVIIAGSGMMGGGRVVRHLAHYLPDSKNMVLVVGYQALGTRGRQIADGARLVEIDGSEIEVSAEIRKIEAYSSHGDQSKLLGWLDTAHRLPQTIFLNHGEKDQSQALAEIIKASGRAGRVIVPEEKVIYEI
ncbi:MBL fold metallo-hydrolase [Patescibacteria group bacterium]|nr:MBL fold metallo-hydrolase [Patescibacteria group bacterium]MBU1028731.1 MBL fold metallo-hydrolase [Patescibacteria group bacterium]MBU1915938.1 MBL fold metallo-hydrolase [Patescibacteria group bacterium]